MSTRYLLSLSAPIPNLEVSKTLSIVRFKRIFRSFIWLERFKSVLLLADYSCGPVPSPLSTASSILNRSNQMNDSASWAWYLCGQGKLVAGKFQVFAWENHIRPNTFHSRVESLLCFEFFNQLKRFKTLGISACGCSIVTKSSVSGTTFYCGVTRQSGESFPPTIYLSISLYFPRQYYTRRSVL